MGLKQIEPKERIFFLKHFTTELIDNINKKEDFKKRIEIEKLKKKFVEPLDSEEEMSGIFKGPIFQPSRYKVESKEPQFIIPSEKRELIVHRMKIPKRKPIQRLRKLLRFPKKQVKQVRMQASRPQIKIPPRIQALTSIQPQAQAIPEGFALGKLELLIRDSSIQSIECLGPNKNILVKRYNKLNKTKIILNQSEITDILDNFSAKAKIPVVGGILKAAVGNLVISAVISEFVGSRFIINKITPYSLIQK